MEPFLLLGAYRFSRVQGGRSQARFMGEAACAHGSVWWPGPRAATQRGPSPDTVVHHVAWKRSLTLQRVVGVDLPWGPAWWGLCETVSMRCYVQCRACGRSEARMGTQRSTPPPPRPLQGHRFAPEFAFRLTMSGGGLGSGQVSEHREKDVAMRPHPHFLVWH